MPSNLPATATTAPLFYPVAKGWENALPGSAGQDGTLPHLTRGTVQTYDPATTLAGKVVSGQAQGIDLGFREEPDSPEESYSTGQGATVRRTFLGPWPNRLLFIQQNLGFSYLTYLGFTGTRLAPVITLNRRLPVGYAEYPRADSLGNFPFPDCTQGDQGVYPSFLPDRRDLPWIFPVSVDRICGVKPIGRTQFSRVGLYQQAKVTLTYASLPYDVAYDEEVSSVVYDDNGNLIVDSAGNAIKRIDESSLKRFVEKTVQPNAQYLTLPLGFAKWKSDGTAFNSGHGRIIGSVDYVYTWHAAPAIPAAARHYLGSVNNVTFDGKKPGLMLYTGCQIQRYIGPHGLKQYNIAYRLKYFEAVNPKTGQPYKGSDLVPGATTATLQTIPDTSTTTTAPQTYGLLDPPINPCNFAVGHNWFLHYRNTSTQPYYDIPLAAGGVRVYPSNDLADLFRFTAFDGEYEHA